ncbi:N-acetylmuramoyl-L-alanine amidase family protein [Deinococcus knuensis]|uniref:N-acetylmuramoyl-L-alanine amidase n=1 Tax=Deinococcus knuensis TaxID=1837380 RepID=A0ABQ2SD84_9DEIO|nr:N-acetylmuramoyl-L-alanine amidase [Deinococcus knuensis]GGS16455.1 N-acetylmuramoyl-L-alanine amidase [Deinococcus knuensis]
MRPAPPLLALIVLLSAGTPTGRAAPPAPTGVFVAYPPNDHRVPFDHVILEGRVPPGSTLNVSGRAVPTGPDGLFMEWWPLKPGVNTLTLTARQAGRVTGSRTLRVTRAAAPILPARPTRILPGSVTPARPVEFWDAPGDTPAERRVTVSVQGSAGARATARLGSAAPTPLREGPPGTYRADLTVPATPQASTPLTVTLTGPDGRTVTATAPGRVTVQSGAARTGTQRPGQVPGPALNASSTVLTTLTGQSLLYPRTDMTFTVVGRQEGDLRVRLSGGQSALITATQLDLGAPGTAPLPWTGGTVQLEPDRPEPDRLDAPSPAFTPDPTPAAPGVNDLPALPPTEAGNAATPPAPPVTPPVIPTSADTAHLTLLIPTGPARPPFTLEQTDPRTLILTLFGPPITPLTPPAPHPLLARTDLDRTPDTTRLTLTLNAPVWGFTADHDGPHLRLNVRTPPTPDPTRPLQGRTLTLDPGHGGTQGGGAGSLGTPEKNLVLPITLRAAELLRAQGATIHLTRTTDTTVGLYERGQLAHDTGSDLLISVHANALPDGRDPRGIRGPEIYYTHPQAQSLAAALLAALRTGLPDLGPGTGLKPGADLALTRPTSQPSVLIETGYLTDPGNLRLLNSPAGQERLAQAIAAGVLAYYQGLGR